LVFISLLWVFLIVFVVVVVMFCMWGLGFLCFMKVLIVKVFRGFTSPYSCFSYLSMDFNVYINIDCETLLGESTSLTRWSKDLTHLMLQMQWLNEWLGGRCSIRSMGCFVY
jgi:hypothetical protein